MRVHRGNMALLCLGIVLSLATSSVFTAPKADFNGDGRADVLVRNFISGDLSAWLIGTGGVQRPAYGTVSPLTGWMPIGVKDVNGDQRTDLLWYNVTSGDVATWLIDGTSVLQTGVYGGVAPTSGWVPVALEEFNADGRTDLLWYNTSTGGVAIWLLSGVTVVQGFVVGTVPRNLGWTPIAAKDFNGDGQSDLLWLNQYTGDVAAWLLNKGQYAQAVVFGNNPPQGGWVPMTSRDFNGDSRADLLWYNTFTGDQTIWVMDGVRVVQALPLPAVSPETGWAPIAAEDVNGDAKLDLLWGNGYSGAVAVWVLSGGQLAQNAVIATVPPTSGWTLTGFDDYNGDGRTDLFWSNAFSSATTTWLLNGAALAGSPSYGTLPPSSIWQPQIPRE